MDEQLDRKEKYYNKRWDNTDERSNKGKQKYLQRIQKCWMKELKKKMAKIAKKIGMNSTIEESELIDKKLNCGF